MEHVAVNSSRFPCNYCTQLLFDDFIFPVYFLLYFLVTMFSQFNVLVLVVLKTPSAFRDFRPFLINSSVLQILMCFLVTFTQVRPVHNTNSLAYLFSGHCKLFSKYVCFFCFDFFQLVFDASSFAIPATLYYKYSKVTSFNRSNVDAIKMKFIFFGTYILSIVVGLIYILTFDSKESEAVELETKKLFPDSYDYTKYAQITGYQDHFWSSLSDKLNTLSVYLPPVISFTLIKLIKDKMNSLKHLFTSKTAALARKFDSALMIQTLIPAVSVLPVYSFHLIDDYFSVGVFPYHEKLLYILLAFPTAVDAFIVIIAIAPYRNSFIQWYSRLVPCYRKESRDNPTMFTANSRVTSTFH